jgi:hypothetical protein
MAVANSANPLIVERIPFSESISLTQDRQSIVEFDMRIHYVKKSAHHTETDNRDAG